MEEKVYNYYKINDMNLIEINRVKVEGKDYVLLINNEEPYQSYVAEVVGDNNFQFIKEKPVAVKVLKEICKDKSTKDRFNPLFFDNKE